MQHSLRRLLKQLSVPPGNQDEQYVNPSWHRPSLYDECRSQPPFRPMHHTYRCGWGRLTGRLLRGLVRWSLALALAWVAVESFRSLTG